jgi:hypothetical protein
MSNQNFFGTYAAVRFATGKKAPGVVGPLLKAGGLIIALAIAIPIRLIASLAAGLKDVTRPLPVQPAPKPTTHRGAPFHFQTSIDELQEMMK